MGKQDKDIAYQNKDVGMKSFADRLKWNTFGVVGLKDMEVVDVLPTNLPAIEANELRLDNLFRLSTGEYAIVDYESTYSDENMLKYLGYVARVSKRLYNNYGEVKPLKMIVIYTADVEKGSTNPLLVMGDVTIKVTESFLIGMDAPFQCLVQYFITKGYAGIEYKSTVSTKGKNAVLFDKQYAKPVGNIIIEEP